MTPYYSDASVTVHAGDCLDILRELADASVDAVVTDPPYGLSFMGREWDSFGGKVIGQNNAYKAGGDGRDPNGNNGYLRGGQRGATIAESSKANPAFQQWCEAWATECLRVLRPGGHMLAFGGTRTSHRLACAIEDAGFEIRDSIAWLYGSGFPKSLDVSKAIDKAAGATREVTGQADRKSGPGRHMAALAGHLGGVSVTPDLTAPATDDARTWQGWGTALKPAHEPIVVARKPLTGTVAQTVLAHGVGALNIDGCRVETDEILADTSASGKVSGGAAPFRASPRTAYTAPAGRWPANVVLDESQAAALDAMSGERPGATSNGSKTAEGLNGSSTFKIHEREQVPGYGDSGGASRFFYTAKADAGERVRIDGIAHPTVKPLSLMRWLVRLVTPPGGLVLEPFAGSGTTVEACILEGFRCVAIEREADYLPLIVQRIQRRRDPVAAVKASGEDEGLFGLLGGESA